MLGPLLGPRAPSPAVVGRRAVPDWTSSCSRFALIAGEGARGPSNRLNFAGRVENQTVMESAAMFKRFRQRSLELEHLDKGDYTAQEYEGCLVELRRVNRWLGDASALRGSLLAEIEKLDLQSFSVVDVGAGSGELLRVIANWAQSRGRKSKLVGLELNQRSVTAILEQSTDFPEITAVRGDAFRLPFVDNQFDYAICSLFTHHFKNADVVAILRELGRVAARRLFVIDLHRHPVAYFFYTTVGKLFLHNRLIREDGALSILRSFAPGELETLAECAGLEVIYLGRRFPYRLVLAASSSQP